MAATMDKSPHMENTSETHTVTAAGQLRSTSTWSLPSTWHQAKTRAAQKKRAKDKKVAAKAAASSTYDPDKDEWLHGTCDEAPGKPSDLETWWDLHSQDTRSPFYGRGYNLTIAQALASRHIAAACEEKPDKRVSGSERRRIHREKFGKDGDVQYLALKITELGSVKTAVVDTSVFEAAIDSGTTVTLADEEIDQLTDFNPESKVKIMGFNGTISSSAGKGTLVGYAYAESGKRIPIRIPNVHVVKGAPHALISVSSLILLGFEFHFTKEKSWVVTPSMDIINMEQRGGLFWLKFNKVKEPESQKTKSAQQGSVPDRKNSEELIAEAAAVSTEIKFVGENDDTEEINNQPIISGAHNERSTATVELTEATGTPDIKEIICKHGDCEFCSAATKERLHAISSSLLHRRFMHLSPETLRGMVKNRNIDFVLTDHKHAECDICKANKITQSTVPATREEDKV
jgi:hypothetical protein